jgi:hypothetical protein
MLRTLFAVYVASNYPTPDNSGCESELGKARAIQQGMNARLPSSIATQAADPAIEMMSCVPNDCCYRGPGLSPPSPLAFLDRPKHILGEAGAVATEGEVVATEGEEVATEGEEVATEAVAFMAADFAGAAGMDREAMVMGTATVGVGIDAATVVVGMAEDSTEVLGMVSFSAPYPGTTTPTYGTASRTTTQTIPTTRGMVMRVNTKPSDRRPDSPMR